MYYQLLSDLSFTFVNRTYNIWSSDFLNTGSPLHLRRRVYEYLCAKKKKKRRFYSFAQLGEWNFIDSMCHLLPVLSTEGQIILNLSSLPWKCCPSVQSCVWFSDVKLTTMLRQWPKISLFCSDSWCRWEVLAFCQRRWADVIIMNS